MALSRTRASRQARDEIRICRQGRGWVVNSYDSAAKADRISHEMTFYSARAVRQEMVITRTFELMGVDLEEAHARTQRLLGRIFR